MDSSSTAYTNMMHRTEQFNWFRRDRLLLACFAILQTNSHDFVITCFVQVEENRASVVASITKVRDRPSLPVKRCHS